MKKNQPPPLANRQSSSPKPLPALCFSAVFFVCFIVYLKTLGPAFMDDDSPETITAGMTLGLQHPPNYPLDALLVRLAGLVPVGDWCFRINVFSALMACLGAGLVALNSFLLIQQIPKSDISSQKDWTLAACPMAGALLLAFSKTYWQEALGAKGGIYMVEMVILLSIFHFLIRQESPGLKGDNSGRWMLLCFLFFGLGFSHYWQTQLIFLPAFILFLLIRTGSSPSDSLPPRFWISAFAIALLGLSPLLYLPLRAHLHPVLNLGAPDNGSNFVKSLLRKYVDFREPSLLGAFFQALKGTSSWNHFRELALLIFGLQSSHIPVHLIRDMKAGSLLLSVLGFFAWRRGKAPKTLMVLCLSLACLLLTFCVALLMPVDIHVRWYIDNYLLPTNWMTALLASIGLFSLENFFRKRQKAFSLLWGAILVALPAQMFWTNGALNDQSCQMIRYDYGANLLKSAPRDTLLFAEGDEDYFPLYYFQNVEGLRPDITMIPTFTLFETWGVEQVQRLHPSLGLALPAEGFADPVARLTYASSELIQKNLSRLPTAFTYFDGAFHRYGPSRDPSLLFRRSGILWEFATPLTAQGPWLKTNQLRIRHLGDCPTNNHDSLAGILQIYAQLGREP